ncbi:conserved domain protein [Peptoniphilus sp. oral taxon 375 str. F0436]|nr:conserved domain protein [Peptoniphilus sp. oral taxon 375 str. F0436]
MLTRLGPTLWGHSNIQAIKDLRGLKMVNRQRGAGTRVLFDYLLGLEGIEPSEIPGYDHEVTTHLAAALAVKNKDVDFCCRCRIGCY